MDLYKARLHKIYYLCLILLVAASCRNISAVYSEQAYQQAVSLKVESLRLMEKATEPYSNYANEAALLEKELQIAYQYALGRPNNEISARMWEILIDPDRNLLGGFLVRWEKQRTFSAVFIDENQKLIAEAFDKIIELESGKIKPSDL